MADHVESSGSKRKLVILGVLLAALVALIAYQVASPDPADIKPVTRRTSDFVVTWRCLACDRTVTDPAGPGPKTCPKCNRDELYASLRWSCPTHGVFDVAFQYDQDGKPTQVKLPKGVWIAALNEHGGWNMSCPQCDSGMDPAEKPRSKP
ncbi:MAG: hypothetical protein GY778_30130 [bacterium]|nr:hypothetical protein [bacterium]